MDALRTQADLLQARYEWTLNWVIGLVGSAIAAAQVVDLDSLLPCSSPSPSPSAAAVICIVVKGTRAFERKIDTGGENVRSYPDFECTFSPLSKRFVPAPWAIPVRLGLSLTYLRDVDNWLQ